MSRHDVEAVAVRLRDVNEQIIDAGRRAGGSVSLALRGVAARRHRGCRASSGHETAWFTEIVAAQANFMRAIAETYTSIADPPPEHR